MGEDELQERLLMAYGYAVGALCRTGGPSAAQEREDARMAAAMQELLPFLVVRIGLGWCEQHRIFTPILGVDGCPACAGGA